MMILHVQQSVNILDILGADLDKEKNKVRWRTSGDF